MQAADPEGAGLLSQHAVKGVLKELSYQTLGLTTLQMVTLISQVRLHILRWVFTPFET